MRNTYQPKISPATLNIKKTWCISYLSSDGRRLKKYGKLNKIKTLNDRLIEANKMIKEILKTNHPPQKNKQNQLIHDLSEILDLRTSNVKKKTLEVYTTHFYCFAQWYREQGCPVMEPLIAQHFLNHISKKVSATTRNNYRHNLKSLFGDICRYFPQRYFENPFGLVKKIAETRKTKDWYKPNQILHLKNHIEKENPTLYLAIQFMFNCFARPNELRQLKAGNLNFELGKLKIPGEIAKTGKTRFVTIPIDFLKELEYFRYVPEHYYLFTKSGCPGLDLIDRDFFSKKHAQILKKLNYPKNYSFYSWKNTGAVKMLMMDRKPMRYISKSMGHHSLDMTDKYFQSLGVDEMENTIVFPSINENPMLINVKPLYT